MSQQSKTHTVCRVCGARFSPGTGHTCARPVQNPGAWRNTNLQELEKELKYLQLQNEKRKEVILTAVLKVITALRLT